MRSTEPPLLPPRSSSEAKPLLADALLAVRSDVGASLQSAFAVAKNKFVKKVRWVFWGWIGFGL